MESEVYLYNGSVHTCLVENNMSQLLVIFLKLWKSYVKSPKTLKDSKITLQNKTLYTIRNSSTSLFWDILSISSCSCVGSYIPHPPKPSLYSAKESCKSNDIQ